MVTSNETHAISDRNTWLIHKNALILRGFFNIGFIIKVKSICYERKYKRKFW